MNDTAEKCKGCTIKHLSDVLVWLDDEEKPEKVRNAYISGNLSHAANHFIHYSPTLAADIRTLRLDAINDDLTLARDKEEIKQRVTQLIEGVGNYQELAPEPQRSVNAVQPPPKSTGGCRCRKQ